MNPTWWRRNRLWLALLVPLTLLALAASSFRLVSLHLPWEYSRPTVARGPQGTLTQEFLGFDDARHTRTVTVKVLDVATVPQFGGFRSIPGSDLWRVRLEFAAAPDQLLAGPCDIELVDAEGVRYGFQGGQVKADPKAWDVVPALSQHCVPEDTPGPDLEPVTGKFVPAEVKRPASWVIETAMAVPHGRTPEAVRVSWTQPDYLVLDVPR